MECVGKRIAYIDYFRCTGILLMIMGHIGFGGKFDIFIHAFHMPMFFLCSGLCYKAVPGKEIKDIADIWAVKRISFWFHISFWNWTLCFMVNI